MARQQHTQFAMKAIDLADLFNQVIGSHTVAGTDGVPFKVGLAAPDGPSTGGGKQSVQHITLAREGLVLVAGAADQVERTTELRTFDYLSATYAQRYRGQAVPLERAAYDAFLKRARDFFATQSLPVTLLDSAPVAAGAPTRGTGSVYVAAAGLIAIAVAVAAYILMSH